MHLVGEDCDSLMASAESHHKSFNLLNCGYLDIYVCKRREGKIVFSDT